MNVAGDDFSEGTGDPEKDMDGRETLVATSLDCLFAAFDSAIAEGLDEPVVLLVDCEDSIGSCIARGWEGDDAVDAAIMANAMDTEINNSNERSTTILVKTVSFSDGQQELPNWFPYLKNAFSQGPSIDGFYVVAISFGGAGVFSVPVTARP